MPPISVWKKRSVKGGMLGARSFNVPLQKTIGAAQMQHAFYTYCYMRANCSYVPYKCIPHAFENIVRRIRTEYMYPSGVGTAAAGAALAAALLRPVLDLVKRRWQ